MTNYKEKIEKEVRSSFEPMPFLQKFRDDNAESRKPFIERVIQKHVAEAIDAYEQKNKLGKYKPKPKRR